MRRMKAGILACLAELACAAQTMPYPVGWVYTTSILDPDNLVFHAASVADTGGESGHTASAVVKLTSPDGRVSYGTGAWGYSSFAASAISFCDTSYQCHDGWFRASSEGTQEYCPITFTYMLAWESFAEQSQEPYAYLSSVRWAPEAVHYQSGEATFEIVARKTSGCGQGNAGFEFDVEPVPSFLKFRVHPPGAAQSATFGGASASASWRLAMAGDNASVGEIRGIGRLMSAPCRILPNPPGNQKDAVLKVQAPGGRQAPRRQN
ncbi:MAG: hypothetical protein ACUVS7_07325 [Bryobacteraceae bacterium]